MTTTFLEEKAPTLVLDNELFVRSRLTGLRRASAVLGLIALTSLPFLDETSTANVPATAAVFLLGISGALLLVESSSVTEHEPWRNIPVASRRLDFAILGFVVLFPLAAVQMWFKSGGAIAGGDLIPPAGTAWIGRLFSPWQWTGSNMGSPTTPIDAPWGLALWIVVHMGGSAVLAQRIWLSILFAGAAVAAFALLRSIGLPSYGAGFGALIYVFNPYVLSVVGTNPVYLASLLLLAGLPACIIAAGRNLIRLRWAVVAFVLAGPLLGYVGNNPPLVILVAVACALSPLAAAILFGGTVGRRATIVLIIVSAALVAVSAYWWIPFVVQVRGFSSTSLAAPSSWTWTEGRSTVANAFWLNTTWGWSHHEYYPYARAYTTSLLVVMKYVLPMLAFGCFALLRPSGRASRLAAACGLSSLVLIFLSTGTRPPGSLLFKPLYALPFGWLLREPGRLLLAVSILYAILVAIGLSELAQLSIPRATSAMYRVPLITGLAFVIIASLAPAFPVLSGALVPGARQNLPSSHVHMPAYWMQMAAFTNAQSRPGALLALPLDDFYQMPYSWYYGSDGFINDLLTRPVLDPVLQGYMPAGQDLVGATNLAADSVLRHDWRLAHEVLSALNVSFVLVRGDVQANFPGRATVPPGAFSSSLRLDPSMRLLRVSGPLELWSLTSAKVPSSYATVNSSSPDLRTLSLLRPGTVLVTSPPQRGHVSIVQASPLANWTPVGDAMEANFAEPPGRHWTASPLTAAIENARLPVELSPAPRTVAPGLTASQVDSGGVTKIRLTQSLGPEFLTDGDFAEGLWGPVRDCDDIAGPAGARQLSAHIMPTAGPSEQPAVRLTAGVDNACEIQALGWRSGPFMLSLEVRHVAGTSPTMCVWESGPNRCASAPSLPNGRAWQRYATIVSPDPGTTSVSLLLYADATRTGRLTVNDYASVKVVGLPAVSTPILIGTPTQVTTSPRLIATADGYSSLWRASGHHVLVDGLRNGWLVPSGMIATPHFSPEILISISRWISTAAAGLMLLVLIGSLTVRKAAADESPVGTERARHADDNGAPSV